MRTLLYCPKKTIHAWTVRNYTDAATYCTVYRSAPLDKKYGFFYNIRMENKEDFMKKFLLNKITTVLILAAITASSLCLLAGCGKQNTFEIVSAALSDSEYNKTWVYVDDNSGSTSTMSYNILPDPNVWTAHNSTYYNFYVTSDMKVTSVQKNGVRFTKVTFGNATILMLYGTGILLNPTEQTFQDSLNYTTSQNNLLHPFMPSGETATVTKLEKKPSIYKISYYNTDTENVKTSENTIYTVYDGKTGKILVIGLSNTDTLTSEELQLAEEFSALTWFN